MAKGKVPKASVANSKAQVTNKNASKGSVPIIDDFVLTISDSDSLPDDESDIEAPSDEEKPDVLEISGLGAHKARGTKRKREDASFERQIANEKQASTGKKRENEDMDSDFEFQTGDLDDGNLSDLEGWGFEGAKSAMKDWKNGVDIDDIISRRKGKKAAEAVVDEDGMADDESVEEEAEEEFIGLEDDEDDEEGFGAGAASEEDEDEEVDGAEEGDKDDEVEEDAESDDESVASAVEHPEDAVSDNASSASESETEIAAKAAFFAPASDANSRTSTSFQQMTLSRPILRGLSHIGFATPTAIQSSTIPVALLGRDIVGGAVTGSGKTAAYMVPILERLLYRPKKVPTSRVVVLCPTRELAMQVHSVAVKLAAFTDIKFCLAVGGLSLKMQEAELRQRPDIVIATPGRFIDHMRNSVSFNTDAIEILVLDEADRMLEDGFADELNEILKTLPKSRQTMLFSATMTDTVDKLVRIGMQKPVRLMVDSKKSTVSTLTQEFIRIRHGREASRLAMLMILVKDFYKSKCIVFFRSKVYAHKVRVIFGLMGLKAAELHGSLSQEQRIRAVENFRDGKVDFLLATDLASRGLDIKNVSYVVNLELPQSHEIYLHRVGRTARAGRSGRSITLAAESDRKIVRAAVKAAQAQKGKVVSRTLDQEKIESWMTKLDAMEAEIDEVLEEEKVEKKIQAVEMQVNKADNLIKHEDEIHSRPRRTWFESETDKKVAKEAGSVALNGTKKSSGKLSGKKKRKLESHDDMTGQGERVYKKTKVERVQGARRGVKVGAPSSKGKPKNAKKFSQKMSRGKGKTGSKGRR